MPSIAQWSLSIWTNRITPLILLFSWFNISATAESSLSFILLPIPLNTANDFVDDSISFWIKPEGRHVSIIILFASSLAVTLFTPLTVDNDFFNSSSLLISKFSISNSNFNNEKV